MTFPFFTVTSSFAPVSDAILFLFPGSPPVCPAPIREPHSHGVDPDERRWQLEWERRNIED